MGLGYNINGKSLRHTHATILIMVYRVPIKVVSRRLGHANVGITLKVYSHLLNDDGECASIMGEIFSKNIQKEKITPRIHPSVEN